MEVRVPAQFTYHFEGRASISEVAKALVAQEKLFGEAILVLEACFPQIDVEPVAVVVRHISQDSPLRYRIEGMLLAAVQEGLIADMPVDLIQSVFGYDVHDSYDSFVSVLILIIGLWGAEKVIQRLKRAKEDFDERKLEAREQALAKERHKLTEEAARRVNIPEDQLTEAMTAVLTKRPATIGNQAMDFLNPARRHKANSLSTAGGEQIGKEALEALPSDVEIAQAKPPTQTEPHEGVTVKFFAHDRENPKKWAASIAEVAEGRKALHLAPDIDAEKLFTRDKVKADVLVTSVLDAEGDYQPSVYYLARVYDEQPA
ncbi:hypothetical protein [Pelagerythrobacter marinus]|uniref:hypothetical protein n=1 Tax=Pelagerythrobacter marinus TaxID=538382 RepID=UPI0020367614|nr:hypothetical protein [Pelagerythrobacter marinus]USA38543.1 hypothetical protein NCF86_09390 [Pelagerythrobacter marinus]WPZ07432.1 hypothetical protein T8T98_02655 [Pelagerythrobacter marinus]